MAWYPERKKGTGFPSRGRGEPGAAPPSFASLFHGLIIFPTTVIKIPCLRALPSSNPSLADCSIFPIGFLSLRCFFPIEFFPSSVNTLSSGELSAITMMAN